MSTYSCIITVFCFSTVASQYSVRPGASQYTVPPGPFDVRLADGPSESEGRLEVLFQDEWGTVCNNGFTNFAADLVCRQLGFSAAFEVTNSESSDTGPVALSTINCRGTETELWQCELYNHYNDYYGGNCYPGEVAIACTSLKDDETLLRFPNNQRKNAMRNYGNVEVVYNGKSGYICPNGDWGIDEANVACKQLGYKRATYAKASSRYNNQYVNRPYYVVTRIDCDGTEERLDVCAIEYSNTGDTKCHSSTEVAGVTCTNKKAGLSSGKVAGVTIACLLSITMFFVVSLLLYATRKRKHIPGTA